MYRQRREKWIRQKKIIKIIIKSNSEKNKNEKEKRWEINEVSGSRSWEGVKRTRKKIKSI